jgi:hypothetical protein
VGYSKGAPLLLSLPFSKSRLADCLCADRDGFMKDISIHFPFPEARSSHFSSSSLKWSTRLIFVFVSSHRIFSLPTLISYSAILDFKLFSSQGLLYNFFLLKFTMLMSSMHFLRMSKIDEGRCIAYKQERREMMVNERGRTSCASETSFDHDHHGAVRLQRAQEQCRVDV